MLSHLIHPIRLFTKLHFEFELAEYCKTQALYYQGQPDFDALVARIHQHIDAM